MTYLLYALLGSGTVAGLIIWVDLKLRNENPNLCDFIQCTIIIVVALLWLIGVI